MQKGLVVDAPSDERQRMLSVLLSLLAVAVDQLTAPAIAPAMQTIQAALNVAPMTARWISIGFNAAYFAAIAVVFAWFSVISLATPSFAPLFAGFTMGIGTWRAVFAVMAIPALLGGIGGLLIFHDPYPPKPLPFSVFTFAALATFLLAFQYLVTAAASDDAIPSPWFALVTAGAATALIVYIIREAHSNAPFFDLRLFETPLVGQGATAGLLDSVTSAALLALRLAGIIVGVPLITILGGRGFLGSKPAMLVGLAIVALAFVVQHIMSTPGVGFWPLAAIGIVQGLAFAFVLGPLAAALFAAVTPAELPSMAVIFKLSTLVGASLSIPLVTAFLDVSIAHYGARSDAVTHAYADLWIAGAAIALAAAAIVAAFRIPPPHQSGSAA